MITRARAGRNATVAVAAAVLGSALLSGCVHHRMGGGVVLRTVTVTPSPRTSSPTASPSPSESIAPRKMRAFPGTCADLLSLGAVENTLGHSVRGDTAFVVGLPDAQTGRLTYLDCRYGITRAGGTPTIEIGVNLYRTPAKAAARIAPTVSDFTAHGASAKSESVAGRPATVLVGGQGADYAPTVVLADGQRTIAITVNGTPTASATSELLRLALLADQRTS